MCYLNRLFNKLFLFSIFPIIIMAQPELRFLPFDWVQYRQTGQINSISFSDRYAFIATQSGGLQRFNLFSNRFEEPITRAQGLQSNVITAVHRASNGVLWVATPLGIEYSLTEEGEWQSISLNVLGLKFGTLIERIGESEQDIWLETPGLVHRIDGINGLVTGVMANPDRPVSWSSGLIKFKKDLSNLFFDYSILNGWMTDLQSLFHPDGREMRITTIAINRMNEIWLGTEDGTFFRGDNTMRTFTPYRFSLGNNDVQDIEGKDSFWLGGRLGKSPAGVSYFDSDRQIADDFMFQNNINMDRTSIYSILELKNEVWFGGEAGILIYNIKQDYWRTFTLNLGGGKNIITSLLDVKDQVWVASTNGIFILNKKDKKSVDYALIEYFRNIYVYDLAHAMNFVYIATESGLFIYDLKKQKIYDSKLFGYKTKDFMFPMRHYGYTAFAQDRHNLYIANLTGIISFNFRTRLWSNVVDPSIFGGLNVKSMVINNNTLFISTINGIVKYEMEKNLMEIFNYPFMGQINDMYIKGRNIWLGTSEGLISYKYK